MWLEFKVRRIKSIDACRSWQDLFIHNKTYLLLTKQFPLSIHSDPAAPTRIYRSFIHTVRDVPCMRSSTIRGNFWCQSNVDISDCLISSTNFIASSFQPVLRARQLYKKIVSTSAFTIMLHRFKVGERKSWADQEFHPRPLDYFVGSSGLLWGHQNVSLAEDVPHSCEYRVIYGHTDGVSLLRDCWEFQVCSVFQRGIRKTS